MFWNIFKKKKSDDEEKVIEGEVIDEVVDPSQMSDEELRSDISMSKDIYEEKKQRASDGVYDPLKAKLIESLEESEYPCYIDYEDGKFVFKHELFDLDDEKTYYKKKMVDMFVLSADMKDGSNRLLDNLGEENLMIANRLMQTLLHSADYELTKDEFVLFAKSPSILSKDEINQFYNISVEPVNNQSSDSQDENSGDEDYDIQE